MKINLKVAEISSFKTQLLAVVLDEYKEKGQIIRALDRAYGGSLNRLAKQQGFDARKGHKLLITGGAETKSGRLFLMGIDSESDMPMSFNLRSIGTRITAEAKTARCENLAVVLPNLRGVNPEEVLRWLAEGILLGDYEYSLKTGGKPKRKKLKKCTILLPSNGRRKPPVIGGVFHKALKSARDVAQSIMLVRDMVNAPSNTMTPEAFASQAKRIAKRGGMNITVLRKMEIEKKGMRLLSAVSSGSSKEPRFVHMKYMPAASKILGRICLVGKGITFDSGGLSLKPPASQVDMKSDMAGAAAVLGTIDAASRSGVRWEIHALMPLCENMPDGKSYRPGDILESKLGKTVEITNTDAEGRLVLADALAYAGGLKPDIIIDLATLTGACVVALGPYTAGLFCKDEKLANALLNAAHKAGEELWRMPMNKALRKQLDTPVADMKNTGTRWGGAITAALFLKEFVGKHRWAHLDIAGPAFLSKEYGFSPRGATGFGVLTLLEFLQKESLSKP